MKLFKKTQWFTLIELLITIAIITILFWAANQLNFNRIGNNERIQIFNTKILSHYETIRNNALLWKWVNTDLFTPDSWKILYNSSGSWSITTQYLSGATWVNYTTINPTIPGNHSITDIHCLNLAWTNAENSWNIAEIIFSGNDITLWWKCTNQARNITFQTNFVWLNNTFNINILNGTMDIK